MIGFIYFFVIVIANTIGGLSGMGGGVIIKPILDTIGAHSVVAISFYSSTAVLVMAVVSTFRQLQAGVRVEGKRALFIASGALFGGVAGDLILNALLHVMDNDAQVGAVQICLTIATLLFAFFYTKYKWHSLGLEHGACFVVCGLLLGFFSSLLGIGGGPINVSLLMFCFGMPIKIATVYSIVTILLSQLAKVFTFTAMSGLLNIDLRILLYVVPAGAIGGYLGAFCSRISSEERVERVFQSVILLVLLLNLYNLLRCIMA